MPDFDHEKLSELFPGSVPTLRDLILQLNFSLGWNQADMAEWMHKDTAEISRLLNPEKPVRPHTTTLEHYVRRYQDAGLMHITLDHLVAARDHGGRSTMAPFDLPAHWLRLVQIVLSLGPDYADATYRKWSTDHQETSRLLYGTQAPAIDSETIEE